MNDDEVPRTHKPAEQSHFGIEHRPNRPNFFHVRLQVFHIFILDHGAPEHEGVKLLESSCKRRFANPIYISAAGRKAPLFGFRSKPELSRDSILEGDDCGRVPNELVLLLQRIEPIEN